MNGPFNSVTDVRKYIADLDSENCPVARRTRELREEREAERERVRKERVAERQRDEQQGAAARNSEAWYAWLDKRISEHFLQYFHKDAEGNVGPLTSAIGEALGHTRVEMRKELEAAIDKLRGEFRIGQGRVPIAKSWDPDEVCHQGDVVSYGGETFQALQDTGKTPAADHPHWRLLASRGRDAISPRICGAFNAHEKYRRFDIAELDGSSFIALYDDPGIPGIDDGWQLLAGRGGKGPPGETGARGQRGARGPRGEDAPTIVNWTLDPVHYRAVPTMSNGTQGAVLELRDLFRQFNDEILLPAVYEAMHAARSQKLLSPL